MCCRLEWFKPDGSADTSRLLRALGLVPHTARGHRSLARWIGVDRAALIADALNIDPWEVGI